jgi:gas vesicle protein
MAYEYDRLEREDGGGSFLMGLLAGTVLGAGLGMLFAPRAGSDLRNQLSDQAGKLRATANDTYQQATEKVSQIVDRGKDAYDRARTNVSSISGAAPTGQGRPARPARQVRRPTRRRPPSIGRRSAGTGANRACPA